MQRVTKRRRTTWWLLATLASLGVLSATAAPAAGTAQAPAGPSRPAAPGGGPDVPGADAPAAVPAGVAASTSGFYRIRVRDTNRRMETEWAGIEDGFRIMAGTGTGPGYLPSHWTLVPLGGDRYSFVNRNSGRCLDVPFTNAGVDVVQWSCHGGTNQQFHVKPVAFPNFYQISASNAPEKVLEADPTTNPDKTIQQWWPNGGLYQQFWFEPV
ncbi:MAG TPA: RICIN domain-containing protein [Actinophytocola sp.]|uniref:RICIN domain-containing protein n=1 Tax=Actinophytocola sp. TaxID=1872138 RepID=UPI002DB71BD6|nr:RICIN domain-containing protein [Actinophytocola sp.]HEU5473326.1 RICIN domain-containing protein [Actinophytocola sp.]